MCEAMASAVGDIAEVNSRGKISYIYEFIFYIYKTNIFSMTLKQITSSIMLVLAKSKLSKDFRIETRHIQFLVSQYRSRGIREEYKRNMQIDPSWLQDMGIMAFTQINSADDPSIPYTSQPLSKTTIPPVVSLPNDTGTYRVVGSSKQKNYYPITVERFFSLVEGSIRDKFDYFFRVGYAVYVNELIDQGNMVLVLDDPLDGFVIRTENVLSGNITTGDTFVVKSGQVIYNSVVYNANDTFVGIINIPNYTGTGVVQYNLKKRQMTIDDEYPMSLTLAEYIVIKILTQEFKIEPTEIGDIRNEGNDESSLLTDDKS